MNRPAFIPPQSPAVLALKAIWRANDDLSAGMSLAVKLASIAYCKAGLDPREAMGRAAFEAERESAPVYHTGQPRREWCDLCEPTRETWRRNPTARAYGKAVRI